MNLSKRYYFFVVVFLVGFVHCAQAQQVFPSYLGQRAEINWSEGILRVEGVGLVPSGLSEAQARLQATGAARADALRVVATVASQISITDQNKVASYRMNLDAFLNNVYLQEPVFDVYDGKQVARVRGQVLLFGVNSLAAHILNRARPYAPTPIRLEASETSERFTGLIIDARSATVVPSLNMVIVDDNENVIYSLKSLPDVSNGMHRYHATLDAAQENYRLVGVNPLVIVPRAIYGNIIHIHASDAQRILNAERNRPFLLTGRVAVVAQSTD